MLQNDFFDEVEKAEDLDGVSVDVVGAVVRHTGPMGLLTRLDWPTINDNPWEVLRGILVGEIDPQPIYHMSRVIGYFSRIENWNISKRGELNDRRKGNYRIE